MDKLARLARIQQLIEECGGTIDGRKKLHKLAYLCQRAGTDLDQIFKFHYYGVFSPSLTQDIETATDWRLIDEAQCNEGFHLSLGQERLPDIYRVIGQETVGLEVAKELARQSPQMLEALTTILYLYDQGYVAARLHEKLEELKPHLSRLFPIAYNLAEKHFGLRLTPQLQA
ncbi:MAG: hypothetical protein HY329_12990 [Chloroflexi bacterium]|nr:hypothetical protein [Chloroflexota bacterium]